MAEAMLLENKIKASRDNNEELAGKWNNFLTDERAAFTLLEQAENEQNNAFVEGKQKHDELNRKINGMGDYQDY